MADARTTGLMSLDEAMAGLPAEFGFFRDRFTSEVEPELSSREDARKEAVAHQKQFLIYAVVAALVLAGAGFVFFQSGAGVALGGVAGFGLYAMGSSKIKELARETKNVLVQPIAREFGMEFVVSPGPLPDIQRYRELGLVPGWDRAAYEDQLTGRRGDAPFAMFEAHLEEKRQTSDGRGRTRTTWVTVFRGQCLVVHFPKPFTGVTKVFRDGGLFNAFMKLANREPKVRLEDPVFEKAFEVFSTDQVEARYLLTPDFMERLLALERTFAGSKLRCAFSGGEMLLCVEGKNLFEPGDMNRPMADLSRVREILQDFAAVFLLIDAMGQRRAPEALFNAPAG
jgi:hypothetical protein